MAVSYVTRPNSTTNIIGRTYTTASGGTFSSNRFFSSFDLPTNGWDGSSSFTTNGPTADGTITRTHISGDDPGTPIIA